MKVQNKKTPTLTFGQLVLGIGFVLLLLKATGRIEPTDFTPESFIGVGGLADLIQRFIINLHHRRS